MKKDKIDKNIWTKNIQNWCNILGKDTVVVCLWSYQNSCPKKPFSIATLQLDEAIDWIKTYTSSTAKYPAKASFVKFS